MKYFKNHFFSFFVFIIFGFSVCTASLTFSSCSTISNQTEKNNQSGSSSGSSSSNSSSESNSSSDNQNTDKNDSSDSSSGSNSSEDYSYKTDNTSNWRSLSVPALKSLTKDYFDSFGIACEYGNFGDNWGTPVELYYEEVQKGLAKHAQSITMGNELKPQFMLCWWSSGSTGNSLKTEKFTASNGKTIDVPQAIDGLDRLSKILTICKKYNLKMRGHVLTWHSQTPDDFFAENYCASYNGNVLSNPVSKEVMTARHEWYIKTILEYVADWESKNGYAGSGTGEHIIWAWDVVNEACADDAGTTYSGTSQNWLRGSTTDTKDKTPEKGGSRWYQIYGDDEFIVNAFRFANAYAPADVPLCYNDYNEYMDFSGSHGSWKTSAILHLLDNVKNGEAKIINGVSVKPRIDVMGMQSHLGIEWPGINGYEAALKRYLNAGYDVHVTELDFPAKTETEAKTAYSDFFTMIKNYGKKSSLSNKVTNVTIWGINNENSWIYKNDVKYPLLFTKENNEYLITPSFTAVEEAL